MAIHVTPIPRLTALTTPAFTLGTTNAAGDALTAVASNSTILTYDASDPAPVAGSPVVGTSTTAARRDHVHVGGPAASVAEMEAASSNTVFATPGRTQNHPGVSKAWCQFHHATVVDSSYNMTSVSNTATGQYTLTLATDMSSATYVAANMSSRGRYLVSNDSVAWTAGTALVYYINTSTGDLIDIGSTTLSATRIAFFGDQ